MKAKWGAKVQSYQVLELRVYRTDTAWVKPSGVPLEQFIGKAPNRFKNVEKRAKASLSVSAHATSGPASIAHRSSRALTMVVFEREC